MLKKNSKIIIISAMILLLGITAYLNVSLNNRIEETGGQMYANYFSGYRIERQSTRDQELLYYDAIIATSTDTEIVRTANDKKLAIIDMMEIELIVEGLIKGQGFEDAVIAMSTKNCNVIVKTSNLQANQVSQIVSVVKTQTGKPSTQIKVIPIA